MAKTPSPPRAKRRTLLDVATMPATEDEPIETAPVRTAARGAARGRANYPSATVYLPRRALHLNRPLPASRSEQTQRAEAGGEEWEGVWKRDGRDLADDH